MSPGDATLQTFRSCSVLVTLDSAVAASSLDHAHSSDAKPRRSTHVVVRTVTSTIITLEQVRQRTTVPGART